MESNYHYRLPPDEVKTPEQAIHKIKSAEREHLYIFRGEKLLCRFIGESDRISVHPRDLVDISDATIVHNHPGGTSFSKEDIEMIIAHNAKELIIVTENFLYSVSRPATGWPAELDAEIIHDKFEACRRIAESMAGKLVSQHQIRQSEKDATIIHYIWVLFFHETDIAYAKKELES